METEQSITEAPAARAMPRKPADAETEPPRWMPATWKCTGCDYRCTVSYRNGTAARVTNHESSTGHLIDRKSVV